MAACQQPAKAQQYQPWLAQANAPKKLQGIIAGTFRERLPGRSVQRVYEPAVIALLKVMKSAANKIMQIELAAEAAEFLSRTAMQNSLCYSRGTAKPSYDSANGADLHLRCGVADEKDARTVEFFLDMDPAAINGNARTLEFNGAEFASLEECFEMLPRFQPSFTNKSECATFWRFRDQPVKVRGVFRYKPDADGIRRHIPRQGNNRLDQRNGGGRFPSGSFCDRAGCAVGSNYCFCNVLFPALRSRLLQLERNSARFGVEALEFLTKADLGSSAPRIFGERMN